MKSPLKVLCGCVLTALSAYPLLATTTNYTFQLDPTTDPALASSIIVGTHNVPGTSGPQIWSSGAGAPVDGNPGGYLSISDATNGGQGLAFVFPDIDAGLPLTGFQIDLDLRVGNGTLGRPADGFAISFPRAGDRVLLNATNAIYGGFAGGDSLAEAAGTTGSGDAENGTKTGVSVLFDSWQGNYLPDTPAYSTPPAGVGSSAATDREGIAVRMDDKTLIQLDLILNRNGKDCVPTTQTLTNNGTGLSMQTGTNAIVTSGTGCGRVYGAVDASGSYTNLVWQHLMIRLTNNPVATPCTPPQYNLTVTWKGVTVVNTNLASFTPYNGRLVLSGRTGGNNQNVHVDNIGLTTVPVVGTTLGSLDGLLNGFTFSVSDNPASGATFVAIDQVLLDSTIDVTAQTAINYTAPSAQGIYVQSTRFTPGSSHKASICWHDSLNKTNAAALTFVVPNWTAFPTNYALPLTAADTSKIGLRAKAYQTLANNPNQIWWTEQQIAGHKGNNLVGAPITAVESANGDSYAVWDGPIDFLNTQGAASNRGFFNGQPSGDNDFVNFGVANGSFPNNVGGGYDFYNNIALEFFGYIYFPTSGVYNMVIGSDDSFQLSVSQSPYDRLGQVLWSNIGSRVPTATSPPAFADVKPVVVDQAGLYPIRLLWENGGGAAALEWYSVPSLPNVAFANVNAYLVNDTNNTAAAIFTYRDVLPGNDSGPYVKSADPIRGDVEAPFYAPVRVTLGDGNGSKSINQATLAISVDGTALTLNTTRAGSTVTSIQTSTANWRGGLHTNVMTFADNLGTNYTYTWTWTALGGAVGLAVTDTTNAAVAIPAFIGVPLGQVDTSKPGFRVRSYQTPQEQATHSAFYEEQIQGMHGRNMADQSSQNGLGYWPWADGTLSPVSPGVIDFRSSYTGNGGDVLGGGAAGKWAYDINAPFDFSSFGLGTKYKDSTYPDNIRFAGSARAENASLEIGTWLVFPNAGTYIMYVNSDDGVKVTVPYGSLWNKWGILLAEDDIGRGMANAGGVETAGTYMKFTIPTAGAYPFRMLWFNGGTDAGIEWMIFQQLSDGTVHRIEINDATIPGSIKAYQTLVAGDTYGPYVSYANPVFNSQDVLPWQPIVVDITDGPGSKTLNTGSVTLSVDGASKAFNLTAPSAGVHHLVQTIGNNLWVPGTHTNLVMFQDNAGNSYSNWMRFVVPNQNGFNAYAAVPVPITNRVDLSQLDISKPGWRVKSYQTLDTANGGSQNQPNTIIWTEEQLAGLKGPNIADQTGTGGAGYFSYNEPIDLAGNIDFNTIGTRSGEYRYNFAFSNHFGIQRNGGGSEEKDCTLMFGGWMVFPEAGTFVMTVNSDDGFKISSPSGRNTFNQAGQILGLQSVGRGNNTGYNPNPFALGGSVSPAVFTIPAPGAYPIRMIYENGGGGLNVEWTMWQTYTNGDWHRVLLGDTNAVTQYAVYQTLLDDEPYVVSVTPTPGSNTTAVLPNPSLGPVGPELVLMPGLGSRNLTGGLEDFTVQLRDGSNRSINTNTITLTFNGMVQPLVITTDGAGLTTVLRRANDVPFWPSGNYGDLVLSYQDDSGNTLSQSWKLFTGFWGTLTNALTMAAVDTNHPGFAMRVYQVDPKASTAGTVTPTRIHVAEQILAGLWGTNAARLTNLNDGAYWDLAGTGKVTGVINMNIPGQGQIGDFQSGGGFTETLFPGIPGTLQFPANNSNSNNCFAAEFLAYVEFPTNGTYTLGVSSDDGFRLTRGFTPPASIGNIIVNSPSAVAGAKPTVQNTFLTSYSLTSPVVGQVVMPNGISFVQGSSTNGEGCVITDAPGALAGKILLMYRSAFCGYAQQVANAAAAGAIGVILVQNRPAAEGLFPQEPGVNPPVQPIPAVEIEQADGNALAAVLATNGIVNVTLTPMENLINPPAVNNVLGEADLGKGASDVLFPVVVQEAGIYPLRLVYFQGGGGGNAELFTVTGSSRVLVNDRTATTGPGPGGSGLRAWYPTTVTATTVSISSSNGNITVNFTGVLQSAPSVTGPWTDMTGVTSPYTAPATQAQQYFRSHP